MTINGPGKGFPSSAGRIQAAQSSGVFKPQEPQRKEKLGSPAPTAKGDGVSISNLLGVADVAPPPTFREITKSVVADVAAKDPQVALEGIKNPWVAIGLATGNL